MSDERDRLVAEHAGLVDREASRYRTWRMERADLRQAGLLGLLIAAARFEPEFGVPFPAYARVWVRKEIQRAIARQEFPATLPPDLVGRTIGLRRALDEHAGRLPLAAAALGISPTTVAALQRQLPPGTPVEDEEDLPVPGYTLADPETWAVGRDFADAARAALLRMDPRTADALILRYGLDDGPQRSYRQIGRRLGVSDHTAQAMVRRAQERLRRLLD
jgi:RNA polymerase sigma factor (sigma-70 family)